VVRLDKQRRRAITVGAWVGAISFGVLGLLGLMAGALGVLLIALPVTVFCVWVASFVNRVPPRVTPADRSCPRCMSERISHATLPANRLGGVLPDDIASLVFGQKIACHCADCGEDWWSGTRAGRRPGLQHGVSPFDDAWMHARDPEIRRLRSEGVARVEVVVDSNACRPCRQMAGSYSLEDAPLLPNRDCMNGGTCVCSYRPL
jgi:hypothetical protein